MELGQPKRELVDDLVWGILGFPFSCPDVDLCKQALNQVATFFLLLAGSIFIKQLSVYCSVLG